MEKRRRRGKEEKKSTAITKENSAVWLAKGVASSHFDIFQTTV
jgi:hypothetical protein